MTDKKPLTQALQLRQFHHCLNLIDSEKIALRHTRKTQQSIFRFVHQHRFTPDDQSRLDALQTYLATCWGRLLMTVPLINPSSSEKSDPNRDYLIALLTQALDCYDSNLTTAQQSALAEAHVYLFLRQSQQHRPKLSILKSGLKPLPLWINCMMALSIATITMALNNPINTQLDLNHDLITQLMLYFTITLVALAGMNSLFYLTQLTQRAMTTMRRSWTEYRLRTWQTHNPPHAFLESQISQTHQILTDHQQKIIQIRSDILQTLDAIQERIGQLRTQTLPNAIAALDQALAHNPHRLPCDTSYCGDLRSRTEQSITRILNAHHESVIRTDCLKAYANLATQRITMTYNPLSNNWRLEYGEKRQQIYQDSHEDELIRSWCKKNQPTGKKFNDHLRLIDTMSRLIRAQYDLENNRHEDALKHLRRCQTCNTSIQMPGYIKSQEGHLSYHLLLPCQRDSGRIQSNPGKLLPHFFVMLPIQNKNIPSMHILPYSLIDDKPQPSTNIHSSTIRIHMDMHYLPAKINAIHYGQESIPLTVEYLTEDRLNLKMVHPIFQFDQAIMAHRNGHEHRWQIHIPSQHPINALQGHIRTLADAIRCHQWEKALYALENSFFKNMHPETTPTIIALIKQVQSHVSQSRYPNGQYDRLQIAKHDLEATPKLQSVKSHTLHQANTSTSTLDKASLLSPPHGHCADHVL